MSFFSQDYFDTRLEWSQAGLELLSDSVEVVVIVDVLSFSTAVEMAVTQGAEVIPCGMEGDEAADLAQKGAKVAVGRKQMDAQHPFSLSPVSLERLKPGDRLVLPSPNGAALSVTAAQRCRHVLCGCFRNAEAVATRARELGGTVAVIAAGELWPDPADGDYSSLSTRPLRPAFEDLVGAGAILSCFPQSSLSPEAKAAVGAFAAARESLESLMIDCASGRELCALGFERDVLHAAQLNCSRTVPRLVDGAYRDDQAGRPSGHLDKS